MSAARLFICRGLPGCGKTHRARLMVDGADPRGSVVRVNRDDLRRMMLPSGYRAPERALETAVTQAQHAMVGTALHAGQDVICDDTNLPARHVRALMEVAVKNGASWLVLDMTDVPLETCVERDAQRTGLERVGEEVIRGMHTRYLAQHHGNPLPVPELPPSAVDLYANVMPYVRPEGCPPAFLIDMDGTTALMNGRDPYDETRVGEDLPNTAVVLTARAWMDAGRVAVFVSGRTEGCRQATVHWLRQHVVRGGDRFVLYMREVGDQRPDHVVKLGLFNAHVRDRYRVEVSVDDRTQVVKLWRRLGIQCWQVADGDF